MTQKIDSLLESEEQIPLLIEGLLQRLGYNERRIVIESILMREENPKTQSETPYFNDRVIPEIRLERSIGQEENSEYNEEKENFEEVIESEEEGQLQSDEGAISN